MADNTTSTSAPAPLSDVLVEMSHDLRTPLNAIIGFADLMHKGKTGALTPEQHEYLADILASSRRLLTMINDVVDLARTEAERRRG